MFFGTAFLIKKSFKYPNLNNKIELQIRKIVYKLSKNMKKLVAILLLSNCLSVGFCVPNSTYFLTTDFEQFQEEQDDEKIIYTVQYGDTLFRIARLFGTTVERLKALNHLTSGEIQEGQKLYVQKSKDTNESTPAESKVTHIGAYGATKRYHIIQVGENMQMLAQKYHVSVNSLLIWNGIRNANTVRKGQKIYLENVARTGAWNYLDAEFQRIKPSKGITRESGMGTLISSAYSPVKLALHRSATVGTYIRVYSEGSGKSVTVKVIGNLPQIAANKDVVIKLSKAACNELGIINQRFPVFLAYEK